MERREFLQYLVATGIGLITAGCGGTGNSVSISTDSKKVQVKIGNHQSKTVAVESGQTALLAIQKAYPYQKLADSTVINGTEGNWRYSVNDIEPKETYAGDYLIYLDSVINLRLI